MNNETIPFSIPSNEPAKPKTGWTYRVEYPLSTPFVEVAGVTRAVARGVKARLKAQGYQGVQIVREQDGAVIR